MIKNTFLLACLLIPLIYSSGVKGQVLENVPPTPGQDILSGTGLSVSKLQELMNRVKNNSESEDDITLNMLLAIPFEQRQYVFPAIMESQALSKKITSHPEIAIFKGKTPTKIPPRLREFATEHLAYLPARYYVFLDPALWKEKPIEALSTTQSGLVKDDISLKLKPHPGGNYTFPKVESLYKISPELAKNYKKTDLTKADVNRLFDTTEALKEYYASQEDPTFFEHQLLSAMIQNDKLEKDLSDPFASLVARLKIVKNPKEIDVFFQKQGWKNANDFALKADRILKAWRVTRLNPAMAIQFQKIRSYPKNMPNTMTLVNLRMLADMFTAPPGDVYFIEPYATEIRKNLKPDFILFLGTPIYME